MSYDLYLIARTGQFDKAAFEAYFGGRTDYALQADQAWCENKDTGVYFSFELPDPEGEEESDDNLPKPALAFNLNLCRPGFFALEAAGELNAVTQELDFDVFDPQSPTPERRPFKEDEFVQTWNDSNRKATAALRQAQPELEPFHLARATLEAAWTWNYHRRAIQARLGDDVFVPRIMFVQWRGHPATTTVWTDAMPVLLPHTDIVLVYREVFAPRRLLRRKPGAVPVPWSEVERMLLPFATHLDEHGNSAVIYKAQHEAVNAFVKQLPESTEPIEGITLDRLTDNEPNP